MFILELTEIQGLEFEKNSIKIKYDKIVAWKEVVTSGKKFTLVMTEGRVYGFQVAESIEEIETKIANGWRKLGQSIAEGIGGGEFVKALIERVIVNK